MRTRPRDGGKVSDAAQELPALRVLVMGRFAGERARGDLVSIDKQGFADAMARIAPRLDLVLDAGVPGTGTRPGRLDVSLSFGSIQDFEPVALIRQVPPLAGSQALRAMCAELASGEMDAEAFRRAAGERVGEELAEALARELTRTEAAAQEAGAPTTGTPPASPRASGTVDSILDMVAEPDAKTSTDAARRAARELAGAVGRGRSRPGRPGPAGRVEALLGDHVAAGLDALLAAPELRALESCWRGIAFLVDWTDFREPIRIDLVATPIDDAAEALRDAAAVEDYDLALAAFELDASARDLERAKELAEAAMEVQTPLVIGAAPAFLGLESWAALRRGEMPQTTFSGSGYDGWRSLRDREEARWLNLVANRLVLRSPYGPDGKKPREIDYVEGGERPGCVGSGVWAIGATVVRAFARTGLCVQISGTRNGLIPDLGLAPAQGAREPIPVEGALGTERVQDLERIGLCCVDHYQRDTAYVGSLRCFKQPARYADAEANADAVQHVALAYQLYASRFAKFLSRSLPEIVGFESDQIAGALRDRIVAFLSTPARPLDPRRVGVVAGPSPDDPEATEIKLRVAPEFKIAGRDVNVMLAFAARL